MYLVALLFGLAFSIGILITFVRSAQFNVFNPLFLYSAFHFLLFVIRPIFSYIYVFDGLYAGYNFWPSEADRITVILAANLGYAAFALFCLRASQCEVVFKQDDAVREERRRLSQIYVWVLAICGPFALYSLVRNFTGAGGNYDGMMLDAATGIAINTKGNGYVADAQLMLAPLCAVLAWLGRFRLWSLLPMIGFVLVRGSTGGRGPFISALAMLLFLYLYEKKMKYPTLRLAAAGLLLASLFSFVGQDRGQALQVLLGMTEKEEVLVKAAVETKPLETMDLANMEFFEYVVWAVPQRAGGYDYFLNNLQVFTEPIPRILWPGKPIGPPIKMVDLWKYGSPIGMTFSLPGMGWYQLGWLGVIIWCGLWGHFTGTIYRRYWQSDQSTLKTAAYMVFVASLTLTFRDGLLLSFVRQTGVYLSPIFVWYLARRYLGYPTLADLRLQAARVWQRTVARDTLVGASGGAVTSSGSGEFTAASLAALPPAVRRRRLALARQGADGTG